MTELMFTNIDERSPPWGAIAMGDSKAVDTVRLAVGALNKGDIDGYFDSFDPSCQRWVAGFDRPLSLTDVRDGLQQLQVAFEGLRLDEDLLFGDDRFACARWRTRGRHMNDFLGLAPAGRSIEIETWEVYEIGAGLVVATWTHGDVGQLFRQIAAKETDVI
jgi:predicted ester cyclase